MIRLLISLVVILIVGANVAIAHCKHRSREVLYPSPHDENINIDDALTKEINHHSHHRKVSEQTDSENLDGEILLKRKHHKGGRHTHRDDPVVHISLELNDKSKLDIDETDRVKPIHKIIKKDLLDLDENHDVNWKHKDNWKIKKDDSDIWKKEIGDWDHKDTERKVWKNNKPYVNRDDDNINDGLNLLSKVKGNINLMVPELVLDRSGDKNALVELNDNIYGFISNTTKSVGDNLHNLETDLLNVNLNFKPLFPPKSKNILDGILNINPITVKRNNEKPLNKLGWNIGNHESNWDRSDEYQTWLRKQHRNKWDNKNSRGVVKDRVIKVHEDEREIDWNNKRNDNKRWNTEAEWKYSSSDGDDNDDYVVAKE